MKRLFILLVLLCNLVWLKAQNPYPVVPIDTVQYVNSSKLNGTPAKDTPDYINPVALYPYGDTVRFEGIVAFNPRAYALATNASRVATWLQRKGGGPWSGVQVMMDPNVTGGGYTKAQMLAETKFEDNCQVGYPVRITARYGQFTGAGQSTGETQMYVLRNSAFSDNSVEQVSLTKDTLVYSTIALSDLMTGSPITTQVQHVSTGEQWEGALVTIPNVTVYSRTASGGTRWNWAVSDANGNVLDIRDVSAYYNNSDNEDSIPKIANGFSPPAIGTKLNYIRGIVTEAFLAGVNRYLIVPLYPDDISVNVHIPPTVNALKKSPTIVTASDSVIITATTRTGSSPISSGWLYFALGYANNMFDSLQLTKDPLDSNKWTAKIPMNPSGSVVKYWVRFTDMTSVKIDYPNNLGINSAYKVLASANITIQDIQQSVYANYSTMYHNDSLTGINIRGVITGNTFTSSSQNLLTLQNGMGPNSAIFIQRGAGDPTNAWNVGDSVNITSARVSETFNTTIMHNIRGTVVSSGVTLPRFQRNIPIDSFIQNKVLFSRPWEAVLFKFDSVSVISKNPDAPSNNGEFSFHLNAAASVGLRVDDMSNELRNLNARLKPGMKMDYIQGPMWFSFGNFKLIPRGLMDLDLSHLDTLPPVITLKGNNPDTIPVGTVNYVDSGAVATDNMDGDLTSAIVKSGTVNGMAVGAYTLKYKVTDSWGLSDSTTRLVIVVDTGSVGLSDNELDFAEINLFPNPAQHDLTISTQYIKSGSLTFTLTNLLGEEVLHKSYLQSNTHDQISISHLQSGLYLAHFKTANGNRTMKLVVME
ncbi:MAG: immunoglobulin-like domain-containing protein [Bacteroidia bacterium]|jgi:hypothetical protein